MRGGRATDKDDPTLAAGGHALAELGSESCRADIIDEAEFGDERGAFEPPFRFARVAYTCNEERRVDGQVIIRFSQRRQGRFGVCDVNTACCGCAMRG